VKHFRLFLLALVLAACSRTGGPAPLTNTGAKPVPRGEMVVTVLPGDTAWEVATRNNVPLRDFLDANDLRPPYRLSVGDRLKLPAPATYKVAPGDDVRSVARMFGVSAAELARLNRMQPPYALTAGKSLRLPSRHGAQEGWQMTALPPAQPSQTPPAKIPGKKPPSSATTAAVVAGTGTPPRIAAAPGKFTWPLQGPVVSGFGRKPGGGQNDGVNIGSAKGAPVRASADGMVAYEGDGIKSYGNLVLVRHGGGFTTAYAHLSKILVKKGDRLKQGQSLGTVGTSGVVDKPQLHFEIRKGREPLDPSALLPKT